MAVKEREQHMPRSGGSPGVVPGEQEQQQQQRRRRNLLKNLILRCSKLQAWELELCFFIIFQEILARS